MAKEAYYFSHDCNARNDEKILAIRMRHGAEGYGIYFMLIEKLREATNYVSVKDYNIIAFDLRVSAEKVKSIIEDFELFSFTEDQKYFYSNSLNRRMEEKEDRSNKAREAANARWSNVSGNADAMQTHSDRNALKEKKVKESKVNEEKEIKESKEENIKKKIFDSFRVFYPGTKRGLDTEYENFTKKHKDYASCLELLLPAIQNQIAWKKERVSKGLFVPEYPNLSTWINQRRWEQELESAIPESVASSKNMLDIIKN